MLTQVEAKGQVVDMVYLRLQSYIQSSVAPRSNQKLSFRYYGAFAVLERIGSVAYRLQLPTDCKIHPVIHVCQLKRHVPPSVRIEDDITQVPQDPTSEVLLVQFLSSRMCRRGASTVSHILVQWDALPASMATWEEAEDLKRRFPRCPAWGQAGFRGGGNVRSKGKAKRKSEPRLTIGRAEASSAKDMSTMASG
jgi:hypothetical protein